MAPPLAAQEPPATDEVGALRAEIEALRADYEGRIAALEGRLAQLEAGGATAAPPELTGAAPYTGTYFNPSVSMIGNFVAVGGHAVGEDAASSAELRESELGLQAIIDPYARADFFLAFGEEGVEVEEGYATLTALPVGLLARVGRMRAGFGKVNTQHADILPWVDQPLPVVNLLGGDEGWIGTGVSVARLIPLGETFSELTLQAFRGDAEGLFEGSERSDLAYNAHYRLFRDLTEATNVDLGVSYGFGPNGVAEGTDTRLGGLDFALRWKPLQTARYRSLTVRGELFRSHREQAGGGGDEEPDDDIDEPPVGEEPLADADALGWFLAADYQLARRWTVGARYEWAERADDADLRDTGEAALLTFRPSEFSLLRAEARRRRFAEGDTATELFLQLQFAMGAHGAHAF
ncbi:MAG TPA: hypothetical protein VGC93_15675 [Thermoanaerobaculia bacterium]